MNNQATTSMAAEAAPETGGQELVITRIFDAPRELVFKVWTDPEHVARWWGPHHFTNPLCELDVRPGGHMLIHMRAPDGTILPNRGTYDEVVEPERLVFSARVLEDADGNPALEVRTTVTFEEHDGRTKLTMHALVLRATSEAAVALAGMETGWNQTLDRLATHLGAIA